MSQRDPFEDYRRRREIELMEREFRSKASDKREKIEKLLSESARPEDVEARVTDEMQEFLDDSTRAAEKMLERICEDEGATGESHDELKAELQNFLKGAKAAVPQPPSPAAAEPAPGPEKPIDLQAALERIRRHGGSEADEAQAAPEAAGASGRSREEILENFDATYQQVSDLLSRKIGAPKGDERGRVLPGLSETVRKDRPRETPLAAAAPSSPPPAPPPVRKAPTPPPIVERPPQGEDRSGAPTGVGGATNRFAAEPEEDRDIDERPGDSEPEGWNIPVRKPPPGAWVVERQKEEGEAGLAGMAGDTYLLKKLSQEVRRLNRVYLVLLEKKIVTREEVEGPGAGDKRIAIDGGDRARADSDDDDCESVDSYEEEKYRPILTNEKDFSLSTLVKDVHRLKILRTVLIRKGIVSEKELAKAKS